MTQEEFEAEKNRRRKAADRTAAWREANPEKLAKQIDLAKQKRQMRSAAYKAMRNADAREDAARFREALSIKQ